MIHSLLNPSNSTVRSGSIGFASETIVLSTKSTVSLPRLRFTTSAIDERSIGSYAEVFRRSCIQTLSLIDFFVPWLDRVPLNFPALSTIDVAPCALRRVFAKADEDDHTSHITERTPS